MCKMVLSHKVVQKVIFYLEAIFVTKCACCCFFVFYVCKHRVCNNYDTLCTAYYIQRREKKVKIDLVLFIWFCVNVPGSLATNHSGLCRYRTELDPYIFRYLVSKRYCLQKLVFKRYMLDSKVFFAWRRDRFMPSKWMFWPKKKHIYF